MKATINGKTYTTTQEAYRANDTEYCAAATDVNGNDVTIVWGIKQEWMDAEAEAAANEHQDYPAILEDESNALDWDSMRVIA